MNDQDLYKSKDRGYYEEIRNEIIRLIPKQSKKVLDVGCGNGATSFVAKQQLNIQEVIGVELFQDAAEIAQTKLDKVIIGDIEIIELNLPPDYFDCIICADVLEHTRDPWEVLRKLRVYLAPNGVLIVSIPNIRHIVPVLKIIFNQLEYEPSGILDKTHLRFFTLHTIREMLQDTGFEIIRIETNKSNSWKFKFLNVVSLGLMNQFSIYQYIIVAIKQS